MSYEVKSTCHSDFNPVWYFIDSFTRHLSLNGFYLQSACALHWQRAPPHNGPGRLRYFRRYGYRFLVSGYANRNNDQIV